MNWRKAAGMEEQLQRALSEQGLALSHLPEKGRCLFTTSAFSPGQVIMSQEPYVSVPNNNNNNNNNSSSTPSTSRCQVCFTTSPLSKCSSCRFVCYCSTSCQKQDWSLHRLECQALSRLPQDKLSCITPSIRLMVRLYLRIKLQDDKVIPSTVTDNYHLLDSLVSHMSEIGEKRLVLYAQMANLVAAILQWPALKLKQVAENFSKLACNAHSICDSELRPLGTGLYPVIAIINHSCLPNAVLMFEGRRAVVRAVQHIPKGTEISISYIETAGSTMTRQKALQEQYLFSCSCPRCMKLGKREDIEESAMLEGYKCDDRTCIGFLIRDSDNKAFICQQCGRLRKVENIKQIAREVKILSEKAAKSFNSGNYEEAGSLYKEAEQLQINLCHPFSLDLMRTRESLMKIFMELHNWKNALVYCRLTIPVYEKVYPGCHPMLGLQYYTCGKLEWLLGETENCIRSLSKALDILQVTHGTNTPFLKELHVKLEEARAEASFKLKTLDED